MTALVTVNIPKLCALEAQYGSVDTYYQTFIREDSTLKKLVKALSDYQSQDKLAQMDVALVAEYLRNVGYDVAKPDRHICRILGNSRLACSSHETVPVYQAMDIVAKLAGELGKPTAEVDYILWSYCAKGYGEICIKNNPKCDICAAKQYCKKGKDVDR